ncbi:MAG: Phosphoglycolate phosphatase [Candidatus Omnitrophica bacterium]|nr:Phosphoglycolate phosphatase [Candidatus Omnitrophota bacterium]
MRRYDLIFFDFDGTLVDTIPDIAYYANAVLSSLGQPDHGVDVVRAKVGKGVHQLLRELCPRLGDDAQALHAAAMKLKALYAEKPVVFSRLYPDIAASLGGPAGRGAPRRVVLTNKLEVLANAILDHFGLRDRFDEVVGDGGEYVLKPDPSAALRLMEKYGARSDRTILIGDSEVDRATAKAAGIRFGWVSYGYEALAPAGDVPDHVFDKPSQWASLSS